MRRAQCRCGNDASQTGRKRQIENAVTDHVIMRIAVSGVARAREEILADRATGITSALKTGVIAVAVGRIRRPVQLRGREDAPFSRSKMQTHLVDMIGNRERSVFDAWMSGIPRMDFEDVGL